MAGFELPQLGDLLDGYRIEAEVGRGAVAVVLRARTEHPAPERRVALKFLRPELAEEAEEIEMFRDERAIATNISHPHVAALIASGEHHGLPYLVFEHVDGHSYADILERCAGGARPGFGFHTAILAQAAEGLHAAHHARDRSGAHLGVVHRDVKPDNLLVGRDGSVKVVDFGVAAARGRRARTSTGRTKGTLAYLAPEQILTPKELDLRVDVWALGVVAWEALSGRRLFRDTTDGQTIWNVVHADVAELQRLGREVPGAVASCVMRCLIRDRDQRPASCAAVAEVLETAALSEGYGDPERLPAELAALFA